CFEGGKGRAVRASDVEFCLLRLMDEGSGSRGTWVFREKIVGLDAFTAASRKAAPDPRRASYGEEEGFPAVAGLVAVDEHTLRIVLTAPFPQLPWLLASPWASIYPPEAVAKYGKDLARHLVTTGPYRLRSYLPGMSLVLVGNPTYRERPYPTGGRQGDAEAGLLDDAGRALPLNDMVVIRLLPDRASIWKAFLEGEIDWCPVPTEFVLEAMDPAKRVLRPALRERGVVVEAHPLLEIYYDAFSMKDPVIGAPAGEKGLALRRAICLAASESWTIRDVYRTAAIPVDGPLLDEFPESDPAFQAPWVRQKDETRTEVLDAAKEILAEVGYSDAASLPVLRKLVPDDPGSRLVFEHFARDVGEVGIRVEPIYASWPEIRKRVGEGKAQMWSSYWLADYPSAQNFFQLFYGPGSPHVLAGGYDDPDFNELYEEARPLGEGEARTKLYRAMQENVMQACPWRFRFRRIRFDVTQPWLHNFRWNEITPRFFETCRVDPAARTAFRGRKK
ncbi:MAG: ABC transporter substrate-binding protein, partial [Planctomycetota bacterium]